MSEHERLPSGWCFAKIQNLTEFVTSGSRGWAKFYADKGAIFVRIGDLDRNRIEIDTSNPTYVNVPPGAEGKRTQLHPEDVLISITADVGTIGIVPENLGEAYVNQHIALCRPQPRRVVPRFLAYVLKDPLGLQKTVLKLQYGATKAGLSLIQVRDLSVPLPPLNEQRRIVAKLDALLARVRRARAALDAIPPLLERLRQSVLAAAFRGDLTRAWREAHPDVEPASALLERIRAERKRRWIEDHADKRVARARKRAMKKGEPWDEAQADAVRAKALQAAPKKYKEPEPVDASELPELPEGWCWERIEGLSDGSQHDIVDGPFGSNLKTAHYVEAGVRVIRLGNLGTGVFVDEDKSYITPERAATLGKHSAEPGDVLVASLAEPVARACPVPDFIDHAIVKADCFRIRPHREIDPSYLIRAINEPLTHKRIEKEARGIGRLRINLTILREAVVPLIPLEEQAPLMERLNGVLDWIKNLENVQAAQIERLGKLEQSILAKAFRGELVSQDPDDEPASALLERLRGAKGKGGAARSAGTGRTARAREPEAAQGVARGGEEAPLGVQASQGAALWQGSLFGAGEGVGEGEAGVEGEVAALSAAARALLEVIEAAGSALGKGDLVGAAKIAEGRWTQAIGELRDAGLVEKVGKRRGAKYRKA